MQFGCEVRVLQLNGVELDVGVAMHVEGADCNELIERTTDAIDDDAVKLLFVSVQRNNLDLCARLAATKSVAFEPCS